MGRWWGRRGVWLGWLLLPSLVGCGESRAETQPSPREGQAAERGSDTQLRRGADLASLGFNEGSATAPVKVVEFSDFGCGYCRRFHTETYPKLQEIYISKGLVEWKYIPISIGFPNGREAALAGECAGEQNRFGELRTHLFAQQMRWRGLGDPRPWFLELAGTAGLEVGRFQACLEGGWREDRFREHQRLAAELGIRGTPTFLLDGQVLPGALPLELFREFLDSALRRRGIPPPGN